MAGARTKRARRLAKVLDVAELRVGEDAMDKSWMTMRDGAYDWYWVPVGISVHNASDMVDESNFDVAERLLEAASDFAGVAYGGVKVREAGETVRYRWDNWVGPPVRTLMVRVDDAGALREALAIRKTLSDYPILSDEDYSEREHDAEWAEWEDFVESQVYTKLVEAWDIPPELASGEDWEGVAKVDLGELLTGTDWWQNHETGGPWDVEVIAEQLAAAIRIERGGPGAARTGYRECRCCGQIIIAQLWGLCDGCDADGECDPDEAWHCDGRAGHHCDGTACEETVEEIAEAERKREVYGGMNPDDMTPLW